MEFKDLASIANGFEQLFKNEEIKDWLESRCYYRRTTFDMNSSAKIEFNEGRRSVYLEILNLIEANKKGKLCQKNK